MKGTADKVPNFLVTLSQHPICTADNIATEEEMSGQHHLSFDQCIEDKQEHFSANDKNGKMPLEEQMSAKPVHINNDGNVGNTSQEASGNETTNLVSQPEGPILDSPYLKHKRKVDKTVVMMRKQMQEGGIKYNLRNVTWKAREEAIDNLVHGKQKK